jgi:hypothetical protein
MEKYLKCRFSFPSLTDKEIINCKKCNYHEKKKSECETCEMFKSRYIEYPITVSKIENKEISFTGLGHECGTFVKIRPCAEEYQNKTFIGIYLGDLPMGISSSYNEETQILTNRAFSNPAIFVPELKKIIFGAESWWGEIKPGDDLSNITDEDINSQWYVQMLKDMSEKK